MSFKPGDFVVCAEAIQFLDYGKVYTVDVVSRDADGTKYNEIRLRGEPGWHSSSRFKLHDSFDENNVYMRNKVAEYSTDYTIADNTPGTPLYVSPTASKNDSDKLDLSLIPQVALKEEAKAFMVGEKKYGRYNYTKGHKASQLVAAAMRHLTAWNDGEDHDPVDGQHHLGSVRACCAMILRQIELGTFNDDRYKK